MRSSRLLISLFATAMIATPVVAQEAQYKAGEDAARRGDPIAARDAFCSIDAGYKDAGVQCTTYKTEADKALNRYKINFVEGSQLLDQGKFDQAEFKLRNVKAGPYLSQAQAKLQELGVKRQQKAQADAAAQQAATADAAAKQKLDQGIAAFNNGDFNSAKNLLSQAGSAGQNYLSRISQFESKMAEGSRLTSDKNYAAALAAYGVAAGIASNGPGDPNGQIARVQQLMSSAAPATTVAKAAVRDELKRVDVQANLDAADKAITKKDYARARRLYNDILAQDFRNAEARAGLERLPQEQATSSSTGDDDPLLASAINQFYRGDFDTAQGALSYYIGAGKKRGLANFYLGAIYLTQYYLGGEKEPSKLQQAKQKFQTAKDVQGFVPPEKYISPKIMKVYSEAAGS